MMKRIVVIGAGPGGIAAATQLQNQAGNQIEIVLIERNGTAEFLPGTLATALGQTSPADWQQPLQLPGITVQAGEVTQVSGHGVVVDGDSLTADFVIAAPGLALDDTAVPQQPNIIPFWSPSTAATASDAVQKMQTGRVAVIVAGLPYRCPPAPFSLAMQLAHHYQQAEKKVDVFITTPEERPLTIIGNGIPEHLERSCAELDVAIYTQFQPDWGKSGENEVVSVDGRSQPFDLALVVPPHVRSPLLRHLLGDGPLVSVSPQFESDEPGLFVIGDAAKTPFPRAAGAATAQGKTAADAILARLGLIEPAPPHAPEPECYIGHGGEVFSKIAMRYPHGLPPNAKPEVYLDAPSTTLADGFAAAFKTWKAQRYQPQ
ncbi:MAG: pyridine nucleotide-disulfide oxidoreductase [Anaerolineaceae bacterium]|nr:pyridine nucleotide-disulfide oxidoreductase [Anaerolineaceae bacterium]